MTEIQKIGKIKWDDAQALQLETISKRLKGKIEDTALLLEIDEKVLSCGVQTRPEDLPADTSGFKVFRAERAGRATYHGPGQAGIVVIAEIGRGYTASDHMINLRAATVAALGALGIEAEGKPGFSEAGVWVGERKIGMIGAGIHGGRVIGSGGIAVNVRTDLAPFALLKNPCGIDGCEVTSVEAEGGDITPAAFGLAVAEGYVYLREKVSDDPTTVRSSG